MRVFILFVSWHPPRGPPIAGLVSAKQSYIGLATLLHQMGRRPVSYNRESRECTERGEYTLYTSAPLLENNENKGSASKWSTQAELPPYRIESRTSLENNSEGASIVLT